MYFPFKHTVKTIEKIYRLHPNIKFRCTAREKGVPFLNLDVNLSKSIQEWIK